MKWRRREPRSYVPLPMGDGVLRSASNRPAEATELDQYRAMLDRLGVVCAEVSSVEPGAVEVDIFVQAKHRTDGPQVGFYGMYATHTFVNGELVQIGIWE